MNQDKDTKPVVKGSAFLELRLSGRWALSLLTDGWSAQEIEDLKNGDEEAKVALEEVLTQRVIESPDDFAADRFELRISDA